MEDCYLWTLKAEIYFKKKQKNLNLFFRVRFLYKKKNINDKKDYNFKERKLHWIIFISINLSSCDYRTLLSRFYFTFFSLYRLRFSCLSVCLLMVFLCFMFCLLCLYSILFVCLLSVYLSSDLLVCFVYLLFCLFVCLLGYISTLSGLFVLLSVCNVFVCSAY